MKSVYDKYSKKNLAAALVEIEYATKELVPLTALLLESTPCSEYVKDSVAEKMGLILMTLDSVETHRMGRE